ncbi:hypothetical protein PkP19E3_26455 [Pseudomonas koreensis]|nr:hypothetical protein PkP19E3_26455 [Pseudomonas koreensis]
MLSVPLWVSGLPSSRAGSLPHLNAVTCGSEPAREGAGTAEQGLLAETHPVLFLGGFHRLQHRQQAVITIALQR